MAVLILLPVALLAAQTTLSVQKIADAPACATITVATCGASTRSTADQWITDLRVAMTTPVDELRGRRVSLMDAPVAQVDDAGFWIGGSQDGCRLYVTPAEGRLIRVTVGELVDLQGEFRVRAPRKEGEPAKSVYAYIVRQSPPD